MINMLIGGAIVVGVSVPAFLYLLYVAKKKEEEKLQKARVRARSQRRQ